MPDKREAKDEKRTAVERVRERVAARRMVSWHEWPAVLAEYDALRAVSRDAVLSVHKEMTRRLAAEKDLHEGRAAGGPDAAVFGLDPGRWTIPCLLSKFRERNWELEMKLVYLRDPLRRVGIAVFFSAVGAAIALLVRSLI